MRSKGDSLLYAFGDEETRRAIRDYYTDKGKKLVDTHSTSEIDILDSLPLEDVEEASSSVVAEAIGRMRAGNVIRNAGYDGVYGTIRLFDPTELEQRNQEASFFEFLEAHDG